MSQVSFYLYDNTKLYYNDFVLIITDCYIEKSIYTKLRKKDVLVCACPPVCPLQVCLSFPWLHPFADMLIFTETKVNYEFFIAVSQKQRIIAACYFVSNLM